MAEEGKFGETLKAGRKEYEQLPAGIATLLKCASEAYREKEGTTPEVAQIRDLFAQLIIVTYREAALLDEQVALPLVHSLIDDYPGAPESCLAPQFCSLLEASLSFRELAHSKNRLLMWQQMRQVVLAYNEFLNALLGFMIPCLRCAQGQQADPGVFSMPYSSRVDQVNSLTGGENGAYYIIGRLAKPRLRNAVAHGTIWLDSDEAKVRYTEGRRRRREREVALVEFGGFALIGSHLAEPYLAAVSTIAVMEDGSDLAQSFLPQHLVRVFRFRREDT